MDLLRRLDCRVVGAQAMQPFLVLLAIFVRVIVGGRDLRLAIHAIGPGRLGDHLGAGHGRISATAASGLGVFGEIKGFVGGRSQVADRRTCC